MNPVRILLFVASLLSSCASVESRRGSESIELDHIFIWVKQDAPEADALRKLGLHGYEPVKHEGQGTSSLGFRFENAYLELIWIDDYEVAKKAASAIQVDFAARSMGKKARASPFGIGLHMRGENTGPPFPTVTHRAAWMQPGEAILVAQTASNSAEPFVFVVPPTMANLTPEALAEMYQKRPGLKKIREHVLGVHLVTGAEFVVDQRTLDSSTLTLLVERGIASFTGGPDPLLRLTFDNGRQGKEADLRPTLPLVIAY